MYFITHTKKICIYWGRVGTGEGGLSWGGGGAVTWYPKELGNKYISLIYTSIYQMDKLIQRKKSIKFKWCLTL